MSDQEKVSEWLIGSMIQSKKTVQEVASITDICSERIRAYVAGIADFDLSELKKLSKCLNQSLPI